MACNCATQEEIDKLYEAYGNKLRENGGLGIKAKVKHTFMTVMGLLMWAVCLPVMFIYVICVAFWEDKPVINVQKLNLLRIFNRK